MKTLLRARALLIVLAPLITPFASHAQANDPAAVAQAFITAVNAGNVDAALALVAPTAVDRLSTPDPGQTAVFTGTAQIRLDLTQSVGVHLALQVETTQVAGATVTVLVQQSSDRLRAAGFPMLEARWILTVQNGQIVDFTRGLTAESVARVNAARAAAQASPTPTTAAPVVIPVPGMPVSGAPDARGLFALAVLALLALLAGRWLRATAG
jgi:ketosteroid isomerase-like protein